MHKQLILVEFNNSAPFVYRVESSMPITIDRVAEHFIETEGFNEDRDSITFIDDDESTLVLMDEPKKNPTV